MSFAAYNEADDSDRDLHEQEQRAVLVTYRREFGGDAYAKRRRETKWVLWELRQRREARR